MKYAINRSTWKITLDNEAIKAIRFCRGFNTDLRISLKYINKDSLFWWIYNERYSLFGLAMCDFDRAVTDGKVNFETVFNDVVRQVVR